jgi:hypothetical protein
MFSMGFLSAVAGLILTLLIFSYLIGDNPLFRMSLYLFIGVASGYGATVVWHYVLVPKLFSSIQSGDPNQLLLVIIPLILCVSLLAKLSPRISWMGNFAMAILVGVGAATAIGGAVFGTLIPQVQAAIDALDIRSAGGGAAALTALLEGVIMLAGTVFTLGYFQFTANRAPDGSPKRNIAFEAVAWIGRIFIAITFGVLFSGVYMAALTAMIERLGSIINFIRQLVGF